MGDVIDITPHLEERATLEAIEDAGFLVYMAVGPRGELKLLFQVFADDADVKEGMILFQALRAELKNATPQQREDAFHFYVGTGALLTNVGEAVRPPDFELA